jgi:8-oxo-dGTP pyrophosphatase MutT (NUDIX family)
MVFKDVVTQVEQALSRGLPGAAAQAQLAPMPRRQWPDGFDPGDVRNAAALLLVFPKTINREPAETKDTWNAKAAKTAKENDSLRALRSLRSTLDHAHIVLTVRADTLGRHGGQVSLPGGVIDPGESVEQAALREAHEEVGLAQDRVRVLGPLTPLDIPVSGFRLHPIVGASDTRPRLTPAHGEVARILEVDLDELLAPDCVVHTTRERDDVTFRIPGFHVHGVRIWGATAMVLSEFLSMLGWTVPNSDDG